MKQENTNCLSASSVHHKTGLQNINGMNYHSIQTKFSFYFSKPLLLKTKSSYHFIPMKILHFSKQNEAANSPA